MKQTAYTSYIRTGLLLAACVFLWTTAEHAFAKTASVHEIIKYPTTEQTPQLLLNGPEVTAIPGAKLDIANNPLFLEKPTLTPQPRTLIATNKEAATVYAWVQAQTQAASTTAENARMVVVGDRVTDFSPGKDGMVVDNRLTTLRTLRALMTSSTTTSIEGFFTKPTNSLANTNTYGITEFLAGGISDFSNSSRNRLANIEAGMQQVKGVLIKPGQTFSFGEYLGDVTAAKGFKPEIVIKADGLKPELGGGICQVSSTLFRAVMASGMPITQRKNHAFSVSHYFPVGTDATIYTPVTDLKFTNDTPAHVLVWPYYIDKTHLAFDLYGTSDGRQVVVDEPIQWDRQANGAVKASWSRHVTKDGVTRDDVLKSNYLPPALFKKEETFVTSENPSASPSPTVTPTPSPTPTPTSNITTQ